MKKFIAYLLLLFIMPMAMEAKKKEFAPGLYWEFDGTTLTISGKGEIPDYKDGRWDSHGIAPWNRKRILNKCSVIKIGEGITGIGDNAFSNEHIDSKEERAASFWGAYSRGIRVRPHVRVILPSTLQKIGHKAFAYRNIQAIDIPEHVNHIEDKPFYHCSLSSFKIPKSWKSIPPYMFQECNFKSVEIPSNITIISQHAFDGCPIQEIIIPEGVIEIQDYAFRCSNNYGKVTSHLRLPNSLRKIGKEAFKGSMILSITMSENVVEIGESAFNDCKGLEEVYISSNAKCEKNIFTILNGYSRSPFNGIIYNLPEQITEDNSSDYGISASAVRRYKNGENGIINTKGKKILEAKSGRNVKIISASNDPKTLYHVTEGDEQGVIDEDGNWFIPLTKGRRITRHETPLYYEISDNEILSRMDANGKWIISPDKGCRSIKEMEINSKAYYLVSKAKYSGPYGLLSATGNQIFPCEYEQLSHAGGQFLKFKIGSYYGIMTLNGKVIIPTSRGYTSIGNYVSSQNVFAYTANGYKGEVDGNGVEKSHIKVETPKQQTASTTTSTSTSGTTTSSNTSSSSGSSSNSTTTSSTNSNTQSNTTTQQTIVVEHHRDPQPMQVWYQCTICYGSGTCTLCGGNGWNPYSYANGRYDRCLSCGGRGNCSYCAGQGGHYQVEYR